MDFEYNDPIISKHRTGYKDDPFVDIDEELIVDNSGKVILTEEPDEYFGVHVDGSDGEWYETSHKKLSAGMYRVDYLNKTVTFDKSNIGQQLRFKYKGKGLTYIPANSIYTDRDAFKITETIQYIVDEGRDGIDIIYGLNQDEAERVANEKVRQADESDRKSNESTRKDSEDGRRDGESDRETNEKNRKSDETDRQSNEAERKSNEEIRESSEIDRSDNEEKRVSDFDSAIEASEVQLSKSEEQFEKVHSRMKELKNVTAVNLKDRQDELDDKMNSRASKDYVKDKISGIGSLSVSGTYKTLNDLKNDKPDGGQGVYIITSNGNWYYWNDDKWTSGGKFQSTEWTDALTTENEEWEVD